MTVETYKLVATGASYTIINLEAVNLTNGSGIEPSFNGLRNGQTINSGETLEFNLQSPFTRNRTVNLRYSFTIKETGDRFTYNVQFDHQLIVENQKIIGMAALACHAFFIVVTNNLREFQRVPGLRLENWLDD